MRTAVLFPGQGSQNGEMRAWAERLVPELVDAAREATGTDVFERAGESTRYVQPALYCAALAGWRALRQADALPADDADLALAGHSLGELAALAAAGAVDPEDGLRLVVVRGALMADAARGVARGGMLAVLGPDARGFVQRHADRELALANDNGPEQVVVAGRDGALASFEQVATASGYRVRRLPLEFAAHSPLMDEVAHRFARELRRFRFRRPDLAVWSCSTAAPFDDVPRRLAEGIARPVLWRDLLHRLYGEGARTFLETGPGRVLTKLARTTLDGIEAQSVTSARVAPIQLEPV